MYHAANKTGKKNIDCVIQDNSIDFCIKDFLCRLAGKYLRILGQIQPDKIPVHSNTELKVNEKLPYPADPNICLNKGMDAAVIITGIIILTR
jgi:hypothetical protein